MTTRRIDQLVGGYADGDAISQEARYMRDVLRRHGCQSDIYASAAHIAPALKGDGLPYDRFDPAAADAVIFHFSTATPATGLYTDTKGLRILRYHNITPAEYFEGVDDEVARQLRQAQGELAQAVGQSDVCWSDSAYNAQDIDRLGGSAISEVLPLFFSQAEFEGGQDAALQAAFGDDLCNWLFVGRIVPNKCIEELIQAFAWYHRCLNPRSRLLIAGSEASCPPYYAMLRLLAARLGLMNVCFTGFVSTAGRHTLYRCADVFVTASRHEGFCLPLIEAMACDVPVVARDAGGMPEAMGEGGVRFDGLDARSLALLVSRVTEAGALRTQVLASQQRRLECVRGRRGEEELMQRLETGLANRRRRS